MRYAMMDTPIGPLTLASTDKGLSSVSFGRMVPTDGIVDESAHRAVIEQLSEYFEGKRKSFDVPLDLEGTSFQMSVWRALQAIPFGQTRSYGDIAESIGKPGAARAVGMANHENPIAVVIPCHRVVGSNGSLTGYAGGLDIKRHLLSIEQGRPLFT
jgi:methylated-DNA-[protein]-cysteine S-methyltransferase